MRAIHPQPKGKGFLASLLMKLGRDYCRKGKCNRCPSKAFVL